MSQDEMTLLRDKALRMLRSARKSLDDGDYDIAAFMAEQGAQLYVKSLIFEHTGEIPRVHALRQLIMLLRELVEDQEAVDEFVRKERSLLIRLEEAYLSSRYVARPYDRQEAEELVEFAEGVLDFVRSLKVEG